MAASKIENDRRGRRRARWAAASPMSARLPAIHGAPPRRDRPTASSRPSPPSTATSPARSPPASITRRSANDAIAQHFAARAIARCIRRRRPGDRVRRPRTKPVKRKTLRAPLPRCSIPKPSSPPTPRPSRSPALPPHRPAGALHRHAFHEPGAGDGAGRAGARHRHRRRDLRGGKGVCRSSSARRYTVAEDFPAFIVNRILLPMINEAIYTLYEGVGTVEAIDTAMRLGAQSSDGAAAARRLHRPRYLPVDHAGAA